jgi:thiamine pyrophosphate-dependent acetolactate synthase large subunit-like protein
VNGGQIISKVITEWGVTEIFVLSGGHVAPVYVEAEKLGVRVIDVRHEATAVFAADAVARLSGVPGVAVVTAGPGVTNTITALKNAQLAQSPVVLIGGAAATLLKNRGALQDIDQKALVRPHVKKYYRIHRLKDAGNIIHSAFRTSLSGVPGPVFVECPMDILYDEKLVRELYASGKAKGASLAARLQNWYIDRHVNRLFSGQPSQLPVRAVTAEQKVNQSLVNSLDQAVGKSKKPVMLIGSGAMKFPKNADRMAAAVESLGIPVYLSGMARGLLGARSEVQYFHKRTAALREADCVILAGVPCDFRLNYGGHFRKKALKIAISLDKVELKKNISPDIKILGDSCSYLIEWAEKAGYQADQWKKWHAVLAGREEERNDQISDMAKGKTEYINPVRLFMELEKQLPENSVIIVDGGDFAATASYTLRPRGPLKWLDPGMFGTLGIGGGFALGAALKYPDHYIWIIYGDGSAGYSLMEYDTFKKYGLKVGAIIGNNGSWEQIARDQVEILGRDTASTLPRSDYQEVARAFGADGCRIESLKDLDDTMLYAKKSMNRGVPYVINAIIGSTDFRKGSISM